MVMIELASLPTPFRVAVTVRFTTPATFPAVKTTD
jgi:hypothetical protein